MTKRRAKQPSFPVEILSAVSWAFRGGVFTNPASFDAAVRAWQSPDKDTWRPGEILPCAKIRVEYWGVANPEDTEYTRYLVDLASDNRESFTALELLFKLHNAVVGRLRDADHQYFEGLVLKSKRATANGPLYEMRQGS